MEGAARDKRTSLQCLLLTTIVKSFIVQALGDLKGTQKMFLSYFLTPPPLPICQRTCWSMSKQPKQTKVRTKKVQNYFYFWQFLICEIKMFLEIL
jgi:hypothetical protein